MCLDVENLTLGDREQQNGPIDSVVSAQRLQALVTKYRPVRCGFVESTVYVSMYSGREAVDDDRQTRNAHPTENAGVFGCRGSETRAVPNLESFCDLAPSPPYMSMMFAPPGAITTDVPFRFPSLPEA